MGAHSNAEVMMYVGFIVGVSRLDEVVMMQIANAKLLPFFPRKLSFARQSICQLRICQLPALGGLNFAHLFPP